MSLFSFGSGSGDIWSSAGFAFVSPINDILDKSSFTLEEILAQDEVLQEVKSLNAKLVDFLCKDSSIREMMAFIAEPPPEGASDNRVFKFPYMSCEIICCEVPHILNVVASENNHAPLRKLFSMLEEGRDLDAHRAGYLEKVLTVLLRHRCGPTTEFLNAGGLDLFSRVVQHLGNFSVMQVAKLLLLPKYAALQDIDAAALMADGRGADGSDLSTTLSIWCNWSDDVEILHTLLREFRGAGASNARDAVTNGADASSAGGDGVGAEGERKEAGEAAAEGAGVAGTGADEEGPARGNYGERSDIHMHLSELLLALISQSSPESSFLKRMYSREMVEPLVSASTLSKEQGREARGSQAALQVLAALADRLVRPKPPITSSLVHGATDMQVDDSMDSLGCDHSPAGVGVGAGAGVGGNQTGNQENTPPGAVAGGSKTLGNEGNQRHFMGIGRELQNVDGEVLERGLRDLVPSLCAYLRGHTEDPSMIRVQIRQEQPRLGSLRLQVVRFIETLVRMDNPAIDQILMVEKAMATLLEMMFTYESSSMLHASVSSAVLNILGMSPLPPTPFGVPEVTAVAAAEQAAEIARRVALSGRREAFQRHLFEDCRLVERILEAVAVNEDAEKGPVVGGARPGQPSTTVSSATASPATGLSAIPEAAAAPDAMAPSPPSPSGGAASGTESAEASTTETQGLDPAGAGVSTSSEHAERAAGVAPPPTTVAPTPGGAASGAQVTVASARPETGLVPPVDGQEEDISGSGSTADAGVHEMDAAKRRQRSRHGRRLGHMGHVLLLSKALMEAQNKEPRPGLVEEGETSGGPTAATDGIGAELAGVPGAGEEGADAVVQAGQEGDSGEANGGVDGATTAVTVNRGTAARKSFVAGLLSRRDCAEQWQDYLSTTLAQELSRQLNPLGGFAVPSRDEENQLTTDFPDEAVDMDDTTGILENIARMQNSPGIPGTGTGTGTGTGSGVSSNTVTAAGTQTSKMLMTDSLELDDDDDDFERMDSNRNSGGPGSSTGIGTLADSNPSISMFTSGSFMSSGGSAWSVAATDGKSTAGVDVSAVCSGTADASLNDEGWANFADFGDPQPPAGSIAGSVAASGPSIPGSSSAGGSAGSSVGGFQSFDTVFSIETSPTTTAAGGGILTGTGGVHVTDPGPGPNAFAPSPPNWGSSSGRSSAADVGAGGTVAEGTGGGNGSMGVGGGLSAFDSNSGGSGTGGFAEFSQYSFDPFSAMMEDPPTSLPLPPTGAQSSLQPSLQSSLTGGSGGGGGGGGPGSSAPVAPGQGENAGGMMDSTADPQAFPVGVTGAGAGAGVHPDEDRMDDDTEEAEHNPGSGVSGEEGGASQRVTDENTSTATPRREPMEDSEAMVASDD